MNKFLLFTTVTINRYSFITKLLWNTSSTFYVIWSSKYVYIRAGITLARQVRSLTWLLSWNLDAFSLSRSYKVKELRQKLSEMVEFLQLPHPFSGCYKPFEKCLIESLQHLLHQGITLSSPIEVKLSGDGAPFYRSTSFILLSFSFPSIDPTAISATGKANIVNITVILKTF